MPQGAQYYYIPETNGFYDVPARQYVVSRNGKWIRTATLTGYNPSYFHPVVVDYVGPQPWVRYEEYKVKYPKHAKAPKQPRRATWWCPPAARTISTSTAAKKTSMRASTKAREKATARVNTSFPVPLHFSVFQAKRRSGWAAFLLGKEFSQPLPQRRPVSVGTDFGRGRHLVAPQQLRNVNHGRVAAHAGHGYDTAAHHVERQEILLRTSPW